MTPLRALSLLLVVLLLPVTQAQDIRAPRASAEMMQAQLRNAERPRYERSNGGAWQPAGVAQRSARRALASADASPGWDGGYGYTWYDEYEQVALQGRTRFYGIPPSPSYDISGSGDELFLEFDNSELVTMGFSGGFEFYGTTYSQVAVNENGYISFTSTAGVPFGFLGDASVPNAVIAGYWTDLDQNGGGSIETLDTFENGREVFVVQWTDVPMQDPFPEAELFTFQIRLYEDGEIRLVYPNTFFDQISATIGIESADASHVIDISDAYANSSIGFVGGDTQIVIQPPPAGGLTVGPYAPFGESLDMVYVTEPCGSQPSRVQEFIVANTTGGTLTPSPSISGNPEFQILSTPGAIPPGGVGYIEVAFVGQPTSGGTIASPSLKTATLTTGANPATIPLQGRTIAVSSSPHELASDGYTTRTSVTACNTNPAPAAALLPFGPSTTDRALSISSSTPDSLTFPTPFRLYGEPYSEVYVNLSGAFTFEKFDEPFRLLLDLPPGDTTAYVAPLSFAFFPSDPGVSGSPQPGSAYGGFRDVTGDGVDDLVVTFYRVDALFGGYVTWQAVLSPSATPGANGTVRFQYFAGDDPTDGEPYSILYDSNVSVNYRGVAGISGDQDALAVETRSRTFWAWDIFPAMYDRVLESVAVELAPRSESILGGDLTAAVPGWRILSAPASGMTVGDFAEQNFVQGISDSYPEGTPTFYTSYDGTTGFAPADSLGHVLTPGEGILWYVFDIDLLPNLASGNSQSYQLPSPLVAAGDEQITTATVPLTATTPSGIRWEMVGNPFEVPLDLSNLASWATGGSLGSAIGQVWDPATSSYVLTSDPSINDELAVWEGMFIEGGTATALEIPYPVAISREAEAQRAVLAFRLEGQDVNGAPAVDRATVLSVRPEATEGYDLYDAIKMDASGPMLDDSGPSVMLAFIGERDGAEVLKAQESRPPTKAFSVPLYVETTEVASALTLSWNGLEALGSDWAIRLEDTETGAVTNLFDQPSVAFEHASSSGRQARGLTATRQDPSAPRFVLHVQPGQFVDSEDAATPQAFVLALAGPNPISGTARLELAMPDAGTARVSVFDVMGREVARLLDGPVVSGTRQLEWDASTVAAGTYLVRLTMENQTRTVKLLVAR